MTGYGKLSLSGLNDRELSLIRNVLTEKADPIRAWLLGSRAKGIPKPTSIIDIAMEGLSDNLQFESLRDRLNNLPLPYSVDVLAIEGVKKCGSA